MTDNFSIFDAVTSFQNEIDELLELLQASIIECSCICIDNTGAQHCKENEIAIPDETVTELQKLLKQSLEKHAIVTTNDQRFPCQKSRQLSVFQFLQPRTNHISTSPYNSAVNYLIVVNQQLKQTKS